MGLTVDHNLNSIASSTQILTISNTGALVVAKGTTGQRPGSPQTGMIRYNTSSDDLEVYKTGGWVSTSGTGAVSLNDAIAYAVIFG